MSPRWFVVLLAAVLAAAAALPTPAQLATLVQDLNDLAGGGAGSAPAHFQVLGDRLLFTAESPGSGRELWVTGGTPGGTELLADACPGECQPDPEPTPLAVIGDLFYFSAASVSGLFNSQLWRTDSTRAGTFPLLDPGAGASYAGPEPAVFFPAVAGSRLLFAATTPEAGTELWASDGTPEGTGLIADLVPGPESGNPEQLTSLGDEAFFFTREPQHLPGAGSTLWASDGTAGGTRRMADLDDPNPDLLTAAAGRLFFVATREARLWVSDGTPGGTRPVAGLSLLRRPYSPYQTLFLLPWRDGVAFVAWDEELGAELWASDGTADGTRRLTDFAFSEPFQEDLQEHEVAAAGDFLFFFAQEDETGMEPWVTDGTPEGTRMLADVCPGACSGIEIESRLLPLGGAVFFTVRDGEGRLQLWRSEGTPRGTVRVSRSCSAGAQGCGAASRAEVVGGAVVFVDAAPDGGLELWQVSASGTGLRRLTRFAPADPFPPWAGFSSSAWRARLGERLLFTADDGAHGSELWSREAGAAVGATLVADLLPDDPASNPEEVIDLGDGVAFTAFDGRSFGVWTHRGDAGGTLAATPREPDHPCAAHRPAGLTNAGGLIFMVCGGDFVQQDLNRSDGTPGGTLRLTELAGRPQTYIDPQVHAVRDGELFFAVTLEGVTAVWRSDGTPEGTGPAFGFGGRPIQYLAALRAVGGVFYVLTGDNVDGLTLWRSDGTEAGTELLATPGLERFGFLAPFLPLGEAVYFTLYASTGPGGDLWHTDGTPEGTLPLATFPGLFPRGLTRLGERLYFIAAAGAEAALWESDGTAQGTRSLAALGPAERVPFESELIRVGSRLFFAAEDPLHGVELWTSDGTAAGTGLARDVAPGPASSFPHELTAAGEELLLFAAGDGVHGVELWASDEHAAEVRLVHDLAPGPASSSPRELATAFTAGGHRLFFSAQDGLFGRELWSLPLHPRLRGCIAGETALCLGDRFRAEVAWRDGRGRNRQAGGSQMTIGAGVFSFFDPESPELAVKVVDGTGLNGHHWIFFGALTNLQSALTVTDAGTGLARRYASPPGRFAAAGDTFAFGPRGASLTGWVPPAEELLAGAPPAAVTARTGAAGTCTPSETRLCLEDGRFAVEVAWRDFAGRTGASHAVPGTGSSGSFWFFHPANVELVLKLVDGRGVNGRFWLFYGALSNVEYTVTVTDTETGAVKSYLNPAGTFASVGDTRAF